MIKLYTPPDAAENSRRNKKDQLRDKHVFINQFQCTRRGLLILETFQRDIVCSIFPKNTISQYL